MKQKVAKLNNITIQEVECAGCNINIDSNKTYKLCPTYLCCQEKGYKFCSQCNIYPCEKLHLKCDNNSLANGNTKLYNMCKIKLLSINKWVKNLHDEY